ncbi:MAG: HAMP domain-containing histidine kinase [Thermoanaerobacteraceae bacterium]|nr:HAMP domain-containing histidine kinase [Thermoanaerobacteraceae bacterium]
MWRLIKMFSGIRGRIVAAYLLITGLLFLLGGGLLIAGLNAYYISSIESILTRQAEWNANFFQDYWSRPDRVADLSLAASQLVSSFTQGTQARVQIVDLEGRLLADSHDPLLQEEVRRAPEVQAALRGEPGTYRGANPATGEAILAVARPLRQGGVVSGVLRISSSLMVVRRVIRNVTLIWLLVTAAALTFAAAVGSFLAGTVVRPLSEITSAAERIARGNLNVTVARRFNDEIGRLADTLNHMTRELRRLDRLKSEFISSISHELRTPLTSIKGFVITLLEGLPVEEQELRRGLEIINRETDRLTGLVEELLDFSRLAAGQLTLRLSPVDLAGLVQDTAEQMRPRAVRQGIDLQITIKDPFPPVEADADRLKQVLVNLVDNALKFTPAGGRIIVALERLDQNLALKVCDTGVGIDPQELPLVTQRFYRGRQAPSGGSGLGLALCEEIIGLHGGRLEIASQPGQGTTVTVLLPAR